VRSKEKTLKIKIDNTDGSDFLALLTGSWLEAAVEITVEGARWEHAGDDFAYAVINNTPGLLDRLKAGGYEIDDGEFSPIETEVECQSSVA